MRIALVSPYSWSFPGGVNRHIESLGAAHERNGHEVRILAPSDPDDRLTRLYHRARPASRPLPENLVPLGRTMGFPANGATSNLAPFSESAVLLRNELRTGGYDVVHLHSPDVPHVCWDAVAFLGNPAPTVATFHTYSANRFSNGVANLLGARRRFNKLSARIAVSSAAKWTAERFWGGEYTVIPNGVDLDAAPRGARSPADHLRVLYVGRTDERKGFPVLLRAVDALRDHVPLKLTVVGAEREEIEPHLLEDPGDRLEVAGRVDEPELWRRLSEADVLCAPSLGGESFGMVLIEAFAAGTPVICSDIAGYRDVARDRQDSILVAPGDPAELAVGLEALWLDPERRAAMGAAGRENAAGYAWPRVADQVSRVYEEAVALPAPATRGRAMAEAVGFRPRGGVPHKPPRRLPSLEPKGTPRMAGGRPRAGWKHRLGVLGAALLGLGMALLALQKMGLNAGGAAQGGVEGAGAGLGSVVDVLLRSSPTWVLVSAALATLSLFLRAISWDAIVRAALPGRRVRLLDATRATLIGVLMSATLPARLGEPSRALVMARRLGRVRETFPVLLGTLVSQTLLNILALLILGGVVVGTSNLLSHHQGALILGSLAPVAVLAIVVLAPTLLGATGVGRGSGRLARLLRGLRNGLTQVRSGLTVFRSPRHGSVAVSGQLIAWALQLLSAYALLVALGLDARAGLGGAAAVLFAVNVTAVLPATPGNVGVFQLAVITVLTGVYGLPASAALSYGLILQAMEMATAVTAGLPALLAEGMSWGDVRTGALEATSQVDLSRAREELRAGEATSR